MGRAPESVAALASAADLDADEALIRLWLGGFDELENEHSRLASKDVARARSLLDLPDARSRAYVSYWLDRTGLNREELTGVLVDNGLHLSPAARRLPKGYARKLDRIFGDLPVRKSSEVSTAASPLAKEVPWRVIGPPCNSMVYLNYGDVLRIHFALVEEAKSTQDPIDPPGPRSEDLVHSALYRPRTSFSGESKYPSVVMSAASLFHSLTLNHAFHNGNKRTALVSLVAFLDLNGYVLTCDEGELFKVALSTARHVLVAGGRAGADSEVMAIAEWVSKNSRRISVEDRPIRWHRLKSRLRDYDCEFSTPSVGNRINIRRTVGMQRVGFIRRKMKPIELATQVAWRGDTTEADPTVVRRIRSDLELDAANGVDSESFYRGHDIDGTIARYRRTLNRLAKI